MDVMLKKVKSRRLYSFFFNHQTVAQSIHKLKTGDPLQIRLDEGKYWATPTIVIGCSCILKTDQVFSMEERGGIISWFQTQLDYHMIILAMVFML